MVRAGWAALLVCALAPAGCGEREQAPQLAPQLAPSPQAWAAAIDAAPPGGELMELVRDLGREPVDAALDPAGAAAGNDEPGALTTAAPPCLDPELTFTSYRERGRQAELCGDRNDDGMVDQCARFDLATGALAAVRTLEVVEAGGDEQAVPERPDPAWYVDEDAGRVTVVDDTVQVCPPDRLCLRFQPELVDEESAIRAWVDLTFQVAAVWIGEVDELALTLEFWDLGRGRRLRRHSLSTTDGLTLLGAGDGVFVLATESDQLRVHRFGRDGSARGHVAADWQHFHRDAVVAVRRGVALVDQDGDGPATLVWIDASGPVTAIPLRTRQFLGLFGLGDVVVLREPGDQQVLEVVSVRPRRTRLLRAAPCLAP